MGQEAGKINIENKERRKKDSGAHTQKEDTRNIIIMKRNLQKGLRAKDMCQKFLYFLFMIY